ncbi:hypothetical protein DFA_11540 [Cavenderia fasciculata]|uniref:GATA-type domain-containing protein n=1 Tax=Cavenderia fasciculata TaxID=261658 RepID=F4QDI2_CACFS|nr:uncharacterized protein DFA_11540 [Cavenderia fasciculata]EGG13779.1 hypothetical protein DFA_11540 [Cavenderia fasciculata]|eukprot:XP_004350487.1 hypothetical protein DFA_11540 [Cavenderia fasciculata]
MAKTINTKKSRGRPKTICGIKKCQMCNATTTPEWRKGLGGCYYCNACGLRLAKHRNEFSHLVPSSTRSPSPPSSPVYEMNPNSIQYPNIKNNTTTTVADINQSSSDTVPSSPPTNDQSLPFSIRRLELSDSKKLPSSLIKASIQFLLNNPIPDEKEKENGNINNYNCKRS